MNSTTSLAECSATDLGRLLQRGELDALELTNYFIARIEAHADSVFTASCYERARHEAARSAARHRAGRSLGILDGVPVAWKDLVDVAGLPTTAGSAIYRNASPAQADAPIVRRLADAGMVTLGKTNLSEFAYSALGLNPHFGTPRNPRAHDVPRVPGGSSSGAAVSVAAGLIPVSIGTDTGGSVRTPAAFNGVVGFKSSEERFDKTGVFPLSMTLDTVGVLAHSVADCLLLDQALRGLPAVMPDTSPSLRAHQLETLGIVVPENVLSVEMEPEVLANFHASLQRLQDAGAKVSWRRIPELDDVMALIARHGNIAAAEGYWYHRNLLESGRSSEVDATVFKRIMAGKTMSAYDLVALLQGRARLGRSLWAALGPALLAMPTVPHVAPPLARLEADADYFASVNLKTIRFTLLGNMLGSCGLALPSGLGAAGMPTSFLLSAQAGQEDRLLDLGIAVAPLVA